MTAREKLAELATLGVNVVQVMPVQSFGSQPNGWGYNPQLFFAPKPSYGTPDELRAFVDEAHRLGIAVWLDVVFNHTDGWTQAPLHCFDGYCPNGTAGIFFFGSGAHAKTPWGPRPDFTQPEVVRLLLGSVDQWMREFRGDGFRWDSTSNIRAIDGQGTVPGGRELMQQGNDRIHALGGMSVAEDLKGWDALTTSVAKGGFGFDSQWDGFGYNVANLLVPPNDDGRDLGAVEGALNGTFAGDPFARLLWTENHDPVGNGGARLPSRIDAVNPASFAARKRSMLAAVLLLTSPGVPMLFMGQELSATGTFNNPPAALAAGTPEGLKVRAFYSDLIRLRRNLDGKSGGLLDTKVDIFHRNDGAKVLGYRRYGTSGEDVIVVVNLKNQAFPVYDIGVSDVGPWRVRLNTDAKSYGDDFAGADNAPLTAIAGAKDGKPFKLSIKLGAYSAVVLTR